MRSMKFCGQKENDKAYVSWETVLEMDFREWKDFTNEWKVEKQFWGQENKGSKRIRWNDQGNF